jgi:transposase-like protein
MVQVPVRCPPCQGINVVRYGTQPHGTPRYRGDHVDGPRTIFLVHYHDTGRRPEVKRDLVDMTLNGRGVRDIVRVVGVSSATVIDTRKKTHPSSSQ